MTERDQIHTLLADLAGQDPPVDIDLDRQIERGRAKVRRRTITVCVAAVALTAVAVGGIVTFRPDTDRSQAPATRPSTPTAPATSRDEGSSGSTELSHALLAQLQSLAPELAQTPGYRLYDMQDSAEGPIHASFDWIWTAPPNQVTVAVDVGRRDSVRPVCDWPKGSTPCKEARHLPDGSIAYLNTYIVPDTVGHAYDVRLDRPDGISVTVTSAAYKLKGAKHDAPLSLERVLEIARKITVKPGN